MGEKKVTIHKSDEKYAFAKMLRNPELSLKATGLLALLLTNDVHWTLHQNQIKEVKGIRRYEFDSAWKELCEKGYAHSETHKGKDGLYHWDAEIADYPKWAKKAKSPINVTNVWPKPKTVSIEPKELDEKDLGQIDEAYES